MLSRVLTGSCLLLLMTLPTAFAADVPPATQPSGKQHTTASGLIIIEGQPNKEPRSAQKGDVVWVNYTGKLKSNGQKFDSSLDKTDPNTGAPAPINFVLGADPPRVIKGLEEGIVGMKVGDKRQLIIPADLAFGDRGSPDGGIAPNAALVFDVELVGLYRGQ